jgi:hypothetical protein
MPWYIWYLQQAFCYHHTVMYNNKLYKIRFVYIHMSHNTDN